MLGQTKKNLHDTLMTVMIIHDEAPVPSTRMNGGMSKHACIPYILIIIQSK